ncbi:hypothetical protein [Streptomyces sp. NPDC048638]
MGPPPPPKNSTGKVLGIIAAVAAVVVVGSAVFTAAFGGGGSGGGSGSGSSDASDAGPKDKVVIPQSVNGGKYRLDQDISEKADSQVPDQGANGDRVKTVGGQYSGGMKSVVLVGMYGTINDPQSTIDHTIRGMKDAGAEPGVAEAKITPTGAKEPLTCGVVVKTQAGHRIPVVFCVWADHSTSGNIARTDAAHLDADPESLDVTAFAAEAAKIRDEVRKPVG